ncbi:hypothetical protein MJM59_31560, partial [Salmonella enterica subsp. enterica serovar Montevideo]|nr:hypothetical protein [Salmonella enterica subsp. enterica serovar Montevideo]
NTLFFKGFNNDIARFPFILAINFRFGHFASAGNRTVEIVGMGAAESVEKREKMAQARKLNALTMPHPDRRPDKKERRDLLRFKHG